MTQKILGIVQAHPGDFADVPATSDEVRALIRAGLDDARLRGIGARVIEARGANNVELDSDDAAQTRTFARQFAKQEVLKEEDGVALADRIHRDDLLIPESLIKQMRELGYFGTSVPEAYGGTEMGNLAMIVMTEELSPASLVAGQPDHAPGDPDRRCSRAAPRRRSSTGCRRSRRAR